MTWTVYGLVDPRDRSVFYVGMTTRKVGIRVADHKSDPASAAWRKCRELIQAGVDVEWCSFGAFEDKDAAKIVEGRLILSIPTVVNSKSSYGLPSSWLHPGWHILDAPPLLALACNKPKPGGGE